MAVNKILFIGLSNVGDVIMTTPVLKSLHTKFPSASFDIVADKRSMNLYGNYPFLNSLYLKDKNKPPCVACQHYCLNYWKKLIRHYR